MRRPLVIFGSNYLDLVKLIAAINRQKPTWKLLGFVDDRPELCGSEFFGVPVLGDRNYLAKYPREEVSVFNNVCGKERNARAVAKWIEENGFSVATLIHPSIDTASVDISRGAIVPDGCVIGSGTHIGAYFTGRLSVVISHDVSIGDFVFMGPGSIVAGNATIEDGVFIGVGATIMSGCRIGAQSMVGAGALVTKDVPPRVSVAGVPARIIKKTGRDS